MRLLPAFLLMFSVVRPVSAEEVTIFAAASLADCLREVAAGFEKATGHEVVLAAGGSSDLARQIRAGAPADVFFSADAAQMDGLEKAGLVRAQDRANVLSNALVVVVPSEGAVVIRGARDLVRLKRLALADPDAAPAGVYARKWLESVGLWSALAQNVIPTLDVRAALAAVESNHVDAGIVYRTDALLSKRVKLAFEVPRREGPDIVFVLAPIAASRKPATAALVRYLTSPEALVVYARHGFIVLDR